MSSILDNPAIRQAALPVTIDQYHRMGDAGLISQRTELLSGVIVEKMNKSPNHSWIVQFLMDCLRQSTPENTHLRQEQPLTFGESEPEPDIALVVGQRDDYRHAHPTTAMLVIEVAVSSAAIDREKPTLLASGTSHSAARGDGFTPRDGSAVSFATTSRWSSLSGRSIGCGSVARSTPPPPPAVLITSFSDSTQRR